MKALLALLFMFGSNGLLAQSNYIDFDTPSADSLLVIDTSNSVNNVWQIGHTTKPFFYASDSTVAIVTDTVNQYPVNSYSIFTLDAGFSNPMVYVQLSFDHKMQTDSLHDGGYIELSIDSGVTWNNIYYYGFEYAVPEPGGINNDIPAFTGTYGWQTVYFNTCILNPNDEYKPVLFRFVFISDSILDEGKSGWMIDNLFFQTEYCEGIDPIRDDELINIYPNPTSDVIAFSRQHVLPSAYISITDFFGRAILSQPFPKSNQIDVSHLPTGFYHIIYSDELHQAVKPLCIIR